MSDELVGGRYQLGELLGRGGMAEVRKGIDTRLGRTVAIKRLRTDLASDATFQARFRKEAQSAASLNHPAVVAIYDTGEDIAADGSHQPYIVMEYVAGRTLRDILREGRKILPERALEITSDVLSALDYSHRNGIIHRDIKPANVMLTPAGDVKVMDFGIARALADATSTMTQTSAVVGTAQYLSPEQARGDVVDSRSDVYSAGCLLYELLTSRPPFIGESPVSVAYQHVREPALPPSTFDATLPSAIDAIVMKSLAKRVEDRYQTAGQMRDDIERYLAGHPVHASSLIETSFADTRDAAPVVAYDDASPDRTRLPLLIGLGVLVIALVIGAAFLIPKLFSASPDQVAIPNVVNLDEATARQQIAAAGLTPAIGTWETSPTVADGNVISQSPQGGIGHFADKNSTVTLTLSSGKPAVVVKNVIGMDYDAAVSLLEGDGLVVKHHWAQSDQPKNQVIASNPGPNTSVQSGDTIVLNVSLGPLTVPNVVGMDQADAAKALTDAGFVPQTAPDTSSQLAYGTVTSQSPKAGQSATKGDDIVIFVSTFTGCPTTNPDGTPADTSTCAPTDPAQP